MAGRLAIFGCKILKAPKAPFGALAMSGHHGSGAPDPTLIIGKREVVGYGFNGQAIYHDRSDFPLPSIRWKEPSQEISLLREKEKGDWNKLSIAEKKELYRASFCQTFAEFKAPSGEWKANIGMAFMFISAALWLFYGVVNFVYPSLPVTFDDEHKRAQLRRIIDLQVNPVQGLASKWDYEKDDWKK